MIFVIAGLIVCILLGIDMAKTHEWYIGLFIMIMFCALVISIFISAVFIPIDEEHCKVYNLTYPMYEISDGEYIQMDKKGNLITYLGPEKGYKYDDDLEDNEYYVIYGEPHYIKRTYGRLTGAYWWLGVHLSQTKDIYYLTEPYINLLS